MPISSSQSSISTPDHIALYLDLPRKDRAKNETLVDRFYSRVFHISGEWACTALCTESDPEHPKVLLVATEGCEREHLESCFDNVLNLLPGIFGFVAAESESNFERDAESDSTGEG